MEEKLEKTYIKKRRTPRRSLQRKAGILHRGEYTIADIIDIGEGGISVKSTAVLNIGNHLVVNFCLPGAPLVSITGEVLYKTQQGYGIEFLHIHLDERRKIRRYIADKKTDDRGFSKDSISHIEPYGKTKIVAFSFDQNGRPKPTAL